MRMDEQKAGEMGDDCATNVHLSVQIRSLHNLIRRYLNANLSHESRSLTGVNIELIMFLARHKDEEIFQYDVERRFSITKSTASRVLGLMEKKGLIERRSVERDARLRRIVLTDTAMDMVNSIETNSDVMEEVLMEGFSCEDRARLNKYFQRMRQNLLSTGMVGGCHTHPNHEELK